MLENLASVDYYDSFQKNLVMNELNETFVDLFSDKEINELIAFYSSPVAIRLRELQSEILKRVWKIGDEIREAEIERILDE